MNCNGLNWFECIFSLGLFSSIFTSAERRLPSFGANPKTISVTGVSSGSYIATLLMTSYSETYQGAGIFLGGNYGSTYINTFLNMWSVD